MTQGPINVFEYEALARERLPKHEYDFVAGGAGDEITLGRTRTAFDSITLRPSMLVDISQVDASTTVLGHAIPFPIMLDPAGWHGRSHPDAERATVRAAGAEGTVMTLSSGSTLTMEQVAGAAAGPIWWQQYLFEDRGRTLEMVNRAREAGYSAIVLTLDITVSAKRERDVHNGYAAPMSPNYAGWPKLEWLVDDLTSSDAPAGVGSMISRSATWSEVEWLAGQTALPLVVKGIMAGEDGKASAECGAKAVVVSNHGARQLDTTFASIEVLPEVVEQVAGRIGGARRGADVLMAVARGAGAVLIGRPMFWGLAVDGLAGLRRVIRILADELRMAMGMCGRPTLETVDASLLGGGSPLISGLA
ncbi:MAG: alpha-hydroxy-acid oxidizing protein [Dehalococcoidia bacterium]|nr:alpha-hydroxy-acid oxidizing protein [Dehalococcoidia bacterium]